MIGGFGAAQTIVGGGMVGAPFAGGYQNLGTAVVGQQVYETVVPEVVKTTGQKFIEVPQMTVMKQMVPEVYEQVVERRVQNIVQEVEKRVAVPQIQTVERVVEVPQIQNVEKVV